MNTSDTIAQLLEAIATLVPLYMAQPEDFAISHGTVAVCIIEQGGTLSGQIFGADKIRGRESYRLAWTKASQVWITGYKTGEYEKLVFADKLDHGQFGINMPDFIGWEGGQPILLPSGERVAVGVSGFRGTSDIEIVQRALAAISVQ